MGLSMTPPYSHRPPGDREEAEIEIEPPSLATFNVTSRATDREL
jgi:hypothetical protein